MKYKYYKRPETKTVVFRGEPKNRIADEDWERYDGDDKWTLVEGLSAECEGGLMFGAWNDIVVVEISEEEARPIMMLRDEAKKQSRMGKKCPHCGSRNTATVLYGMPALDEELIEMLCCLRCSK